MTHAEQLVLDKFARSAGDSLARIEGKIDDLAARVDQLERRNLVTDALADEKAASRKTAARHRDMVLGAILTAAGAVVTALVNFALNHP